MTRNKTETKITIDIPKVYDKNEREDLAERIMEYIRERSMEGKNVYGNLWAGKAGKYSKQYAKKKGADANGPVDLSLSFSMLESMRYFKSQSKDGKITIGYRKGSADEKKAEGNILGTYGKEAPIPGKQRPFLDILKKDLDFIMKEFDEEIAEDSEAPEGFNPFTGERNP